MCPFFMEELYHFSCSSFLLESPFFVLYFLVLCVHDVLLCLPLQLDLLFTSSMMFFLCYVLHENAAVVMQTDLSLLHFLFLLDFGERISCVVSITLVSLFSVSLSPMGYHPPPAFTDDSLLKFLWVWIFLGFNFFVFSVLFLWDRITILPCQQRMRCIGFNSDTNSSSNRPILTMIRIFHLFQNSVLLGKCRPNVETMVPPHL